MTAGVGGATPAWLAGRDPVDACSDEKQLDLLHRYAEELARINRNVNLVSRGTADELWSRHIVHSLFLGLRGFAQGTTVVDWGTGGGLPLVPLAIVFPDVRFVGVDSIGKKVRAVQSIVRALGIANVELWHGRAEEWSGTAHYSVSRATAPLSKLWHWHMRVAGPATGINQVDSSNRWPRGLICLKGGDLSEEIGSLRSMFPDVEVAEIPLDSSIYGGQFATKAIITVSTATRGATPPGGLPK